MRTHEAMTDQVLRIVDALIEGIRVADVRIQDRSSQALGALGIRVLPRLKEVAEARNTTARHRSRLLELMGNVFPFEDPAANVSQIIVNAFIESLRTRDARLRSKVMTALRELPPNIVSPLIFAAAAKRKSRGYCLNLLRAVRELGHPVTGANRIPMVLLNHRDIHPLIREEAARVLELEPQSIVAACCRAHRTATLLNETTLETS